MFGAERAAFASALADSAEIISIDIAENGGLRNVSSTIVTQGEVIKVSVEAEVPTLLPGPWNKVTASVTRVKES